MNNQIYKILINRKNKIPENILDFVDLVKTSDVNNEEILIEKETLEQYKKLEKYIYDNENIIIGIANSYRTAKKQEEIYKEFVKLYGKDYADRIVAPVNCSEHQSGLAIDLEIYFEGEGFISNNRNFDRTRIVFEEKVHRHLHKFGFILRYPEGKEEITEYPYEPWHIRFVGYDEANEIYNNDITFEEYKKIL